MRRWIPTVPVALLLVSMTCQVSVLPETLGAAVLCRIANAGALLVFLLGAMRTAVSPHRPVIWGFYILPVFLVLMGIGINVGRSLSPQTVGYVGQLLPWSAALAVPFMRSYNAENVWKAFYRFMYLFSVVALGEYYAVFSEQFSASVITTERGDFLQGVVTIFHLLEDGTPHYRMYGVFPEPGTYAMLLIPAVTYALLHKRWIALAVFGMCLFLTGSFGGVIGMAVTGVVFLLRGHRHLTLRLLLTVAVAVAAWTASSNYFVQSYEDKGASATVRERNVIGFLGAMPEQIGSYPFGAPLDTGHSLSALGDFDANYVGLNFAPYAMLLLGGVLALIGYVTMLAFVIGVCLKELQRGVRAEIAVACAIVTVPAMLLFAFQRQTVFETTLFALLFAWPLLSRVRRKVASSAYEPSSH